MYVCIQISICIICILDISMYSIIPTLHWYDFSSVSFGLDCWTIMDYPQFGSTIHRAAKTCCTLCTSSSSEMAGYLACALGAKQSTD